MSVKISELPSANSVGNSDVIPIVQSGTTKKATANLLKTTISSTINSSSTNDTASGSKAVYDYSAPISHSSSATTYGVGTESNYGHCKTINNLTTASYVAGESLSAYQGKVLDDAKENVSNKTNVLDENSTSDQYPNAEVTYTTINNLDTQVNAEIASLQAENDLLLSQIPTNEASGKEILLNDASNMPIVDFRIRGNNTATNLFNGTLEFGNIDVSTGNNSDASQQYMRVRTVNKTTIDTTGDYIVTLDKAEKYSCHISVYDSSDTFLYNTYATLGWASFPITIPLEATQKIRIAFREVKNGSLYAEDIKNLTIQLDNGENLTGSFYMNFSGTNNRIATTISGSNKGVTFTTNPDFSYTLNGKASGGNGAATIMTNFSLPAGRYFLGGAGTNALTTCYYNSRYYDANKFIDVTEANPIITSLYVQVHNGITADNETIYPILARSNHAVDYELPSRNSVVVDLGEIQLSPADTIHNINGTWYINNEPIANATLIETLNQLLNHITYKKITQIWANVTPKPILDITYRQDLKTVNDNLDARISLLE